MNYASVDAQIQDWAQRHSLTLFTSQGEREIRAAYVSTISKECFQIWIEPPVSGQIWIYAACIEGRRENDSPQSWCIDVTGLGSALDNAFQTVTGWVAPSKRFFPP